MTTPPIQTLTDELLGEIEAYYLNAQSDLDGDPSGDLEVLDTDGCRKIAAMAAELRTLRAENAELRKDAAIARDHLISARHDVEYRSQYGSEAARLVLAGIDQYLGDTAMEQAK